VQEPNGDPRRENRDQGNDIENVSGPPEGSHGLREACSQFGALVGGQLRGQSRRDDGLEQMHVPEAIEGWAEAAHAPKDTVTRLRYGARL